MQQAEQQQQQQQTASSTGSVNRDMLGGGQCGGGAAGGAGGAGGGGFAPETAAQLLHSIGAVDSSDHKSLKVSGPVQQQNQQQNQQLLLTPAGLQLAQLQAQLTLQRLKLAQGGSAASAASVLNQVLSNVAMSQPLFNQLRSSSVVGSPQGAFHTGVVGFPPSTSAYGAFVGGGLTQTPATVRVNQGATVGQHGAEYGSKSSSAFPTDTDRRLPVYNLVGTSSAAPAGGSEGQYSVVNTQANSVNSLNLHRDYSSAQDARQQSGFEHTVNVYNSSAHQEQQWKGHLGHMNERLESVPSTASAWTVADQTIRSEAELYKPEEPTSDSKFSSSNHNNGRASSFGPGGTQGFGHYQPLHSSEEALSTPTKTLQPYQVNDYHAVTPTQLPHQCSICSKKVYNLKDWDQHVKGKLHLQNKMLYTTESSAGAAAVHYAVGGPADGGLNSAGTGSMVYSGVCQDVPSGASSTSSYLPGAAMKTYPSSQDPGFASHQLESKSFPPRKSSSAGRVVHICNLPEGSCTENDVVHLGLPFGKVTNYILMRSTHQAFLEMAYVEAAQAMVQYYQLSPATINSQKLLIRMSKRYKELQLKKPGKDVQSIIQDLSSQRGREEQQELEHYIPERTRSRSPISRSLSPHSPSFTSCSSAHSPQGTSGRAPDRSSNGLGPRRGSWDWRSEEERSRDERPSVRSAERRGGGAGGGIRDWHSQVSPQGAAFASYRCSDSDYHLKDKGQPQRASYQRHHELKARRRSDDPHDLHDLHGRSRHMQDYQSSQEGAPRRSEDRGRSKRWSHRHDKTDRRSKEKSASPQDKSKDTAKEAQKAEQPQEEEVLAETEEEEEEDGWYPNNMEELLTVDEVGEDDSVTEPDLPQLEQQQVEPQQVEPQQQVEQLAVAPPSGLEVQQQVEQTCEELTKDSLKTSRGDGAAAAASANHIHEKLQGSEPPAAPPAPPGEELKELKLEEAAVEEEQVKSGEEESLQDHQAMVVDRSSNQREELEVEQAAGAARPPHKESSSSSSSSSLKKEIEAPSPSRDQDKAVSEHSIPLGVEFIVPQTGFFCQLCRLFYSSEDAAKTTHCRSTVHYRNLQKYLTQLAVEGVSGAPLSGDGGATCAD